MQKLIIEVSVKIPPDKRKVSRKFAFISYLYHLISIGIRYVPICSCAMCPDPTYKYGKVIYKSRSKYYFSISNIEQSNKIMNGT